MTDQVEGGAAVTEDVAPKVDGRVLRSERTRAQILNATRLLIAAGTVRPTVADVARYAGVSTRSVFQHFDDVGVLYAAALTPEMRGAIAAHFRAMTDADLVAAVQGRHGQWPGSAAYVLAEALPDA